MGRPRLQLTALLAIVALAASIALAFALLVSGGGGRPRAAPASQSAQIPPDPGSLARPGRGAAASAPPTSGEIKIGVLAPLSGSAPMFGVMVRDGVLMAADEWNARGGVLGRKVVPVVEDSQCLAGPATRAVTTLVDFDKVRYIVGEVCSAASLPVSDIANSRRVILITPSSTHPDVTVGPDGTTKAFVFRACFADEFQGMAGARFALEELGARSAFLMVDPADTYKRDLAELFERAFVAGGGRIAGKATYSPDAVDFAGILDTAKALRPDVIYLPEYYNVVNLVTAQARLEGVTAPFLGGDGWNSADLDLRAAAGGYFTDHFWHADPRPEVKSFVRRFGMAYQDDRGNPLVPDTQAALAYDATNVLLQAIAGAGADDTLKVKAALESISFSAVTGLLRFDARHNPSKPAVVLRVKPEGIEYITAIQP